MSGQLRAVRLYAIATSLLAYACTGEPPSAVKGLANPAGVLKAHIKDCGLCPEMVALLPGTYEMGSEDIRMPGRPNVERPKHTVSIAYAFAVGRFEVTRAEWGQCVSERGCPALEGQDQPNGAPVVNVTWHEATAYTAWLSRKTAKRYRLLSEAEWEYAARAGSSAKYFWGDSEKQICQYANVFTDSGPGCGTNAVALVGQRKGNKFGLFDVSGNAFEWTEDCWNPSYAGAPADGSAWLNGDCSRRVVRGGSWRNGALAAQSAARGLMNVDAKNPDVGFRVLRIAE